MRASVITTFAILVSSTVVSPRGAGSSTELDGAIFRLPGSQCAELNARIGHHDFCNLGLVYRRIAPGCGIEHRNGGAVFTRQRKQRRRQDIRSEERRVGKK